MFRCALVSKDQAPVGVFQFLEIYKKDAWLEDHHVPMFMFFFSASHHVNLVLWW